MASLYSQALAYWYGEDPSTIIVSQEQLDSVKLKSVKLREQAPPGPARFLPDSLTGKKLNSETVPVSSILITQKQLDKVKLKKAETKPKPKFFILDHPVLTEVKAAGLIRCSKPYRRSSSITICEGIRSYFKDRGFESDTEDDKLDDKLNDKLSDKLDDKLGENIYPVDFERSCPIAIRKRSAKIYDDWSFPSSEEEDNEKVETDDVFFPPLLSMNNLAHTGDTTEEASDSSYWDTSDSDNSDNQNSDSEEYNECVTPKQELISEYDDIPSPTLSLSYPELDEEERTTQYSKQHMNIRSVKRRRKC
tara:strand:- start:33 stop:950 length:918 start_codon:yes stop_codon:yes gene_type:complete